MKRRLTHGSTFSGIGAAEIAAESLGWENLFHCEINDFGRSVLDFHFPEAKSYGDIKQTNFECWRGRIDVLTGGFPCQPFSTAGKRHGANDNRYLWGEMLRCITEIQPSWFVGENVVGINTMVLPCEAVDVVCQTDLFGASDNIQESRGKFVLEEICRNLESIGYSVQPIIVPACAVSAPHRRDRIFIIANRGGQIQGTSTDSEGCPDLRRPGEIPCKEGTARLQERNNVLIPGVAGQIPSEVQGTIEDPCCNRCDDDITEGESDKRRLWKFSTGNDERICREERIRSSRFGQDRLFSRDRWEGFPTQPPLLRGHDGVPFDVDNLSVPFAKWRTETLKAYGNAIVPQVIFEIFRAIEIIENGGCDADL